MHKIGKYFRTKMDNEVLQGRINEFEFWDEIQSKKIDQAFQAYLDGISPIAPQEVKKIFELIEQGSVLGAATECHEKWECLEYLRRGYTLEQIRNGEAHKAHQAADGEWKDVSAHAEARFKEYRFYQFCYKNLLNKKSPPLLAFFLVHPFMEVFNFHHVDIDPPIIDYLISEFGRHEESVRSEKCFEKDLKDALGFFERTGYDYENKKVMLERALDYLGIGKQQTK